MMRLLFVYGFLLAYAYCIADVVDPKLRCPDCGRLDFSSRHSCER